jgi:voltage-gated potassium channel
MIVCGAGATGRHIITELFNARTPVVAIDIDEESLTWLRERHPDAQFEHVVGDATDDDVLAQAGITEARGLAATLPSDKDNLYIIVSTRQRNSRARIVARITEVSHAEKLKRAGADSVVAMNYIGGRRIASEMMRPVFMRFLDDMIKDTRASYRLRDVTIQAGSTLAGRGLGDAAIREKFGMSVLAIGDGAESWRFNPDDSERLEPGSVVIVLGSSEQVDALQAAATAQTLHDDDKA